MYKSYSENALFLCLSSFLLLRTCQRNKFYNNYDQLNDYITFKFHESREGFFALGLCPICHIAKLPYISKNLFSWAYIRQSTITVNMINKDLPT